MHLVLSVPGPHAGGSDLEDAAHGHCRAWPVWSLPQGSVFIHRYLIPKGFLFLPAALQALHGDPSTAVEIAVAEAVSTISQKQRVALQEPGPSHTGPRGRGRLLFVKKLFRRKGKGKPLAGPLDAAESDSISSS